MVSAYSLGSGAFEVDDLSANTIYAMAAIARETGILGFLALSTCLGMIFYWSLTSLGLMLTIAKSWIPWTLLLAVFSLLCIGIVASVQESLASEIISSILFWVVFPLFIPGTILLFYLSARQKLISMQRVVLVSGGYVVLVMLCFAFTGWLHSIYEGFDMNLITLLALCTLPFAAIGGTPLAVRWNRQR